MRTNAIQNNEYRSMFVTVGQGAAIGAAAGLVGKYALPLTVEEKNDDEYVKVRNQVNAQKNVFSFRTQKYIDSIKSKDSLSPAEDEFVKMFDGMKENEKLPLGRIRTAIGNLADKKQLINFKKICKESSAVAEKTAKQCMNTYDLITKHLRPTGFFLATGAFVGVGAALLNDMLKVKVQN